MACSDNSINIGCYFPTVKQETGLLECEVILRFLGSIDKGWEFIDKEKVQCHGTQFFLEPCTAFWLWRGSYFCGSTVRKHVPSHSLVLLHFLNSEDKALESAVVKVISPTEQRDVDAKFQEPSSSLVLKELLREAPELVTEQLAHLLRGERWLFLLNTGRLNGVSLDLLMQKDCDPFLA